MQPRPPACPIPGSIGCVRSIGPVGAPIVLLGEAAGRTEAARSEPFVGDAGWRLNSILEAAKLPRESVRIANTRACHPPRDWLVGAPWEHSTCTFCDEMLADLFAEQPKVVVTLGGTALRKVMGFSKARGKEEGGIRVQDFHGAPMRDPLDRFWVVPTFHPSFLNRGQARLFRACVWDMKVAAGLADGSYALDLPSLIIDPPFAWFEAWAAGYLEALRVGGPEAAWLAVDIETPDKGRKTDEGELKGEDASYEILFVNFAISRDEGITVPFVEPYIGVIKRVIEAGGRLLFHNGLYDIPRLIRRGISVSWSRVWDSMDAWHVLHSALPRGLGFVAPFYSRTGPWKHLGNTDGTYRAMDGVQTWRVMEGVHEGLVAAGMWDLFLWRCAKLAEVALRPAEEVGLPFDRPELEKFRDTVTTACDEARAKLEELVPIEVRPLDGPWVKPREGPTVIEKRERKTLRICKTCGAVAVVAKHRCKGEDGKPLKGAIAEMVLEEREVTLYYERLPFNPAAWQQVLAYIKHRKHSPGRARKTGKDTTDKKTITRLTKTGDPFYKTLLEFRQAHKMKGTYADGILSRLDGDDRVHGTFTNTPSTLRTACVPLDTEILTAKGWKKHDELELGELVVGYDVANDALRLTPLEAVHRSEEHVGFVKFRNKAHDTANGVYCTENHSWVTEGNTFRGFTPARHLSHLHSRSTVVCAAKELSDGDSHVSPLEAAIIGWTITDGHIIKSKHRRDRASLTIRLAKPQSIAAVEQLLAGVKHTRQSYRRLGYDKLIVNFYVGTAEFSPIWHKLTAQPLAELVLSLSREARLAMWDAMMEADGSIKPGHGERFGALKEPVKDAFSTLAVALGRHITYTTNRKRNNFADFHVFRRGYRGASEVGWMKHRMGTGIQKVWCPQTGCGTWIARTPSGVGRGCRRVGQVVITGNSADPNLQNLANHVRFAKEFRRCVKAREGAILAAPDYAGIEAVLTGYFSGDPVYIRLARLGIHSYITTHAAGKPADLKWSDDDLRACFAEVKEAHPKEYDTCKRVVHGTNYGLTPYGMADQFPELFPKRTIAEKLQTLYFDLCPKLKPWQIKMQRMAHSQGFLGGPGQHPFSVRHEFYDVLHYRRGSGGKWVEQLGDDAKRAVAFYPQSTAGCILFRCCLRLFAPEHESFIGDGYFGKTPLRALIHDEIFLEISQAQSERVREITWREMTRPVPELPLPAAWGMGTHLSIGVAWKEGLNWAPVDAGLKWSLDGNPEGMHGVAADEIAADVWREEDEEDEEAEG